jgi:hypothetical protein
MGEDKPPPVAADESADGVVQFARTRTLDHEVKRLPHSMLEKRRLKRQQTINEELLARQTKASERGVRWAIWAAIIALLASAIAAWPIIKTTWE